MLWPTWEQGTEFAKAIAPIVISAAVLFFSVRQNLWQRGHNRRDQALATHRLQSELLDRRLAIIKIVSGTVARYSVERTAMDDRNEQLFDALLEGQTIFDRAIGEELQATWIVQVEHHNLGLPLRIGTGMIGDPGRDALKARVEASRETLFARLQALQAAMIEASRIDQIPPGALDTSP